MDRSSISPSSRSVREATADDGRDLREIRVVCPPKCHATSRPPACHALSEEGGSAQRCL